jgi:hypothetical protein
MEKLKVYIAGKITGTNEQQCIDKFQKASDMLTIMGFEPINPMTFNIDWKTTSSAALLTCIPNLEKSDILFMLKDWRSSEGAIKELNHFSNLKSFKYIVFEEEKGYSTILNFQDISCNNLKTSAKSPKLYPVYEEN